MRPVTLCLSALAARTASWLPVINASNGPICSALSGLIGWRPSPPDGSNIPSATSSAVPSCFDDRPQGAFGKAKSMGTRITCCIVMCHRLEQSRIATKRLGSQSPLQSFQTHSKTMEAEILSKSGGCSAGQSPPLRPTDATASTT